VTFWTPSPSAYTSQTQHILKAGRLWTREAKCRTPKRGPKTPKYLRLWASGLWPTPRPQSSTLVHTPFDALWPNVFDGCPLTERLWWMAPYSKCCAYIIARILYHSVCIEAQMGSSYESIFLDAVPLLIYQE